LASPVQGILNHSPSRRLGGLAPVTVFTGFHPERPCKYLFDNILDSFQSMKMDDYELTKLHEELSSAFLNMHKEVVKTKSKFRKSAIDQVYLVQSLLDENCTQLYCVRMMHYNDSFLDVDDKVKDHLFHQSYDKYDADKILNDRSPEENQVLVQGKGFDEPYGNLNQSFEKNRLNSYIGLSVSVVVATQYEILSFHISSNIL
jgi:hypothetical protein